jgi:hypothetical protein
MPIPQIFYLNAPSLGSATAVFYDAALTVCAADGYYSDGLITREQVGCVLLPEEDCEFCGESCSALGIVETLTEKGVYTLSIDTGQSPTDIGAIIIEFNAGDYPIGVSAVFDGVVFNEVSSETYGYLASTIVGEPTYIGEAGLTCGIIDTGGAITLDLNEYDPVGVWNNMGTVSVNIDLAQEQLTATNPSKCIMVVPKLDNLVNTIDVSIIVPCIPGMKSNVTVSCPSLLRLFTGSIAEDNDEIRCDLPTNINYYVAPVNGVNPFLGLYDWIFTDAYGENKLADGKYKTNFLTLPNDTIEVQDGVIISITQTCF